MQRGVCVGGAYPASSRYRTRAGRGEEESRAAGRRGLNLGEGDLWETEQELLSQ